MQIKPKKSLGQNFLVDKNIQRKIIKTCAFDPFDAVVEIGAGTGIMTALLATAVGELHAFEIDHRLERVLADMFKGESHVHIHGKDILTADIALECGIKNRKIKVFGNIPYYITTPIIEHLFAAREHISVIFITVQKEFAERIVAEAGTKLYGSFSCFVRYFTVPRILMMIPKGCFNPRPKVDSCLLRLEIRQQPAVQVKDEALLFKLIRTSFQQRRKILRNSLRDTVEESRLAEFFVHYGIDKNIRPERLSLEDFARLVNFLTEI
ncbi:MAG: 16S rRNA (adenine(1518)-N(6)/adenine(1519)-N(6))-dimethyltransferase RsmA [Candidatus Omnitrophota bacterium]|jgi:16S rRNA (adenine1518-N6/adenine1519-N6)-dimethyltransferase